MDSTLPRDAEPQVPDARAVVELSREAVAALKLARDQIRDEREKLDRLRSELNGRQEEQRAGLKRAAREVEAAREELASHRKALEADLRKLQQDQEAQVRATATLEDRKRLIDSKEAELLERDRAWEPRVTELRHQEAELKTRSDQLEAYAAELANAREKLTAMQAEMARGEQELTALRAELLERLGTTTRGPWIAPALSTARVGPPEEQEEDAPAAEVPSVPARVVPKPAASPAADQFRKLRRDAKRKAIGV
jgi:DNA repair exonuclease SbcCD ATPase subunit